MAMSQAQWFTKLKSFLPSWWYENEKYQIAVLEAMAAVFAELDIEADNHFNETFISKATAPVLDAHGAERSVDRLTGELDAPFSQRIRYIINQSNPVDIKTMVDSLLIKGKCDIREHGLGDALFASRGSFCNRHEVFTDISYDTFSIVVDKQLHDPYSFLSRENFASREDFIGSSESSLPIFQAIAAAVNKAKAFGVLYRISETND
jgi:hypothetical protein